MNRKRVRVEAAAGAEETDARVGGIIVWHNKDKTRQEFQLGQRCLYLAWAENCLRLLLTVTVAPDCIISTAFCRSALNSCTFIHNVI